MGIKNTSSRIVRLMANTEYDSGKNGALTMSERIRVIPQPANNNKTATDKGKKLVLSLLNLLFIIAGIIRKLSTLRQ
jgi:hypothetical protein